MFQITYLMINVNPAKKRIERICPQKAADLQTITLDLQIAFNLSINNDKRMACYSSI